MRFFVHALDGRKYVAEAELSDTILTLKQQVHAAGGPPADRQRLIYCGCVHGDSETLGSLHVHQDSVLHVVEVEDAHQRETEEAAAVAAAAAAAKAATETEAERLAECQAERQAELDCLRAHADAAAASAAAAAAAAPAADRARELAEAKNVQLRAELEGLGEVLREMAADKEASERALRETSDMIRASQADEMRRALDEVRAEMRRQNDDAAAHMHAEQEALRKELAAAQQQLAEQRASGEKAACLQRKLVRMREELMALTHAAIEGQQREEALGVAQRKSLSAAHRVKGEAAGLRQSLEDERAAHAKVAGELADKSAQVERMQQEINNVRMALAMERSRVDDVAAERDAVYRDVQSVSDGAVAAKQVLQEQCDAATARAASLELDVRSLTAQLSDADARLAAEQRSVQHLQAEVARCADQIVLGHGRIAELKAALDAAEAAAAAATANATATAAATAASASAAAGAEQIVVDYELRDIQQRLASYAASQARERQACERRARDAEAQASATEAAAAKALEESRQLKAGILEVLALKAASNK